MLKIADVYWKREFKWKIERGNDVSEQTRIEVQEGKNVNG